MFALRCECVASPWRWERAGVSGLSSIRVKRQPHAWPAGTHEWIMESFWGITITAAF